MTLQANALGEITGKFTIPANVPSGSKKIEFTGSGGSKGSIAFFGQSSTLKEVRNLTTVSITERYDPLAQTFTLPESMPIGGVDLLFTQKGATAVIVQVRGVSNGVPNNIVFAEARILPAAISLVNYTRIAFPMPAWLSANTEYAIVVLCNDSDSRVAIAELGKWDATASKWVTAQAYQVGVLLSSSNASTWTAHQDRDMTFRLLKAEYTQNQQTISLGSVAVDGATDLLLTALSYSPTSATRVEYILTLPDASTVSLSDSQPFRLPAAVTGNIGVSVKLIGEAVAAPVVFPGGLLVGGAVSLTADYVSVAIKAGTGSRIRVIYDATLPSGSSVVPSVSGIDAGDVYQSIPQLSTLNLTSEKVEFTHEISGVNELFVRVKLTLTGTSSARPMIENLRVIVM